MVTYELPPPSLSRRDYIFNYELRITNDKSFDKLRMTLLWILNKVQNDILPKSFFLFSDSYLNITTVPAIVPLDVTNLI
ncbi:MAG: hypothetical protein M1419_02915 [Bacteroidetes bacterium]|nr:hypothetical protein [Bacteroidota bacterium]